MNTALEQSMPMMPIKDVLDSLNKQQLAPAISSALNIRVVAGPGTGKTKTMEARVAYLLSNKVDPKRILALSFTNESSKEFSTRIQQACGYQGHQTKTGTFHAVFNRILRIYSNHDFFKTKLGYPDGFFIIDDDDSKKLLKESINNLPKGLKQLVTQLEIKPKDFMSQMSLLRSKCHTPITFAKTLTGKTDSLQKWKDISALLESDSSEAQVLNIAGEFSKDANLRDFLLVMVWDSYARQCRAAHAIDFDDVLVNTYYLLRHNPEICRKVATSLDHVLIDEYQDTNSIQAYIIQLLKKANPALSLFIVGDGRQSIYDFRGSDVSLMTNAQQYFGEFEDHELIINYRSSSSLINCTNVFAKDMPNQITLGQLECGTPSIPNAQSEYHEFNSDIDEAKWVVSCINQKIAQGVSPDDVYVIYRTRTAARCIESELQNNHIHFEMVGEKNFYERTEVRDALAFFRAVVRPKDVLAWSRLCDCMPVSLRGMWLRDKYMQSQEVPPIDLIKSRGTGKNAESIKSVMDFYDIAHNLLRVDHQSLLREFQIDDGCTHMSIQDVSYFVENSPEAMEAFGNWRSDYFEEVLTDLSECYVDMVKPSYAKLDQNKAKATGNAEESEAALTERLRRIGLVFDEVKTRLINGNDIFEIVDDLMTRDTKQREEAAVGVKLLTGHASKGLEAKICFLVGCDAAIWQKSKEMSNKELDEASRLYYVMSTRAKEQNLFTSAKSRYMYDKTVRTAPFSMIKKHVEASVKNQTMSYFDHSTPIHALQHTSTVRDNATSPSEAQRFTSKLRDKFKVKNEEQIEISSASAAQTR
ncbi:ATP-dependent helicase [Vibrio anguillarum]|uniref:ATP-dependent helicase n=4 Tax=Vibrio anguillarum TaxID=55601 RepID=UPI0018C33155|nr:ATP-dependent helicase [Vibrio anguillarum]MBF4341268.1 ATP-dependent helicase [Vibrio anguillarum]